MNSKQKLALYLASILVTPTLTGGQQSGEKTIFNLPFRERPVVSIHTIARMPYTPALDVNALRAEPIIGQLTGYGQLQIDDRSVNSAQLRRNCHLVVGSASSARADLGELGKLTIAEKSDLTITAGEKSVYTRLTEGRVKLELPAGVSSYVEANNTLIVNRTDAPVSFTVNVTGERVSVGGADGSVTQQSVVADDEFEIAFLTRREERMKPNRSLELQVKVTDRQRRPRPGTTVVFNNKGNVPGSFSQQSVVTDANGIARTSFTAGPQAGTTLIEASIPGSSAIATMTVQIQSGLILGFNTMQVITIAGIAGVTAFGVQKSISNSNDDSDRARRAVGNEIEVIGSGN